MDIERPHRTTSTPTTTSELFICFTSRLSKSSSMRLSSKSIQSPAHPSDNKSSQPHSLSTSLSRRLRHNRSLRGGAQSPAMFPSSKKNRGSSSGFAENPEPSSPKVTCIGQVRVKTKKQGKKMKMRACRSKRLSGGGSGEVSFRRIEHSHEGLNQNQQTQECGLNHHRNQRWVHLPLTICEALRAFGSEFSCLFPCKSSCFSSGFCGGEKGEKERESSANSCAVFRWLVSLQDGDEGEGKRRDIELVVGGEEEDVEREVSRERVVMERECSRRRSIFDDMEFDDLFDNVKNSRNGSSKSGEIIDGNKDEDEEESGRVSICVPPKNALLLMRCRSDPIKMASLSHRLWDPPLPQDDDDGDDNDNDNDNAGEEREVVLEVEEDVKVEDEVTLEEKSEVIKDETKVVEAKTEEIEAETEETEAEIEAIEEMREELGDRNEEVDEMLEDLAVGESSVETLPAFVGEEEQNHKEEQKEIEEKQETEQKQKIENREISEHGKCDIAEETQVMEDEDIANECSIESTIEEEKVEDEQDLVITNSEVQREFLKEEEEKKIAENKDLINEVVVCGSNSTVIEEEKEGRENAEESSTDLSTISSSSSCMNSSEESTAESKEEEKDRVEEYEQEKVGEEEGRKLSMEEEQPNEENKSTTKLPDCLLLMMCEPKLSMEVSKETWVCSTDFIRRLPERHQGKKGNSKTDGSDDTTNKKKKAGVVGPQPPPQPAQRLEAAAVQPGRSSISFPAGSVANLIEKKLVKAGGYEPLVLTRCKSAPIRSTGKVAAPEMACGRKFEPHRPATFGVGF